MARIIPHGTTASLYDNTARRIVFRARRFAPDRAARKTLPQDIARCCTIRTRRAALAQSVVRFFEKIMRKQKPGRDEVSS
jgi:hypothetical protein